MKIIPIKNFLPKPLELKTGKFYKENEVIEAVTKYTAQFEQAGLNTVLCKPEASESAVEANCWATKRGHKCSA